MNIEEERKQKAHSMSKPYTGDVALEVELVQAFTLQEEQSMVLEALDFLRNSSFKDREPNYMAHSVRVAHYFLKYGEPKSARGVALALLHNIFEVTDCDPVAFGTTFGTWVLEGGRTLVVDRQRQAEDKSYMPEYYNNLRKQDAEIQQIKILDKMDNILVLFLNPSDEVRSEYLDEIERELMPMVGTKLPKLEESLNEMIRQARCKEHQTLEEFLKEQTV